MRVINKDKELFVGHKFSLFGKCVGLPTMLGGVLEGYFFQNGLLAANLIVPNFEVFRY